MDILLDDTGDVAFSNQPTITASKDLDLSQRLRIRLGTFEGEWFTNVEFGVPWFSQVLGKNRSKAVVDAIIQEQVYLEPDVLSIRKFTSTLDKSQRRYTASMEIVATDQTIITLTNSGNQFIFTPV